MNLEIGPTKNNHQEAQSDHLAEYIEFNRFLKSEEQGANLINILISLL
jgi:hypothetical protein